MATEPFSARACTSCGVVYDESGFRPNSRYRDGYTRQCRSCHAAASNQARKRRVEAAGGDWRVLYDTAHRLEYYRKHRAANPEYYRAAMRKHKYGVTAEEYPSLLEASGGLCAICQRPMDRICIDHDHTTGKVRGLLCHNCNVGIGYLSDDIDRLRAAITYLGG